MDRLDSWKKTEERDLDLLCLLRGLCMQWKRIIACAAGFAVLFGAYGIYTARAGQAAAAMPGSSADAEGSLTKEQRQEVADAVTLAKETDRLEEYMEGSVWMKLDAFHKNGVVSLFSIEGATRRTLPKIVEAYVIFISNGGLADSLKKAGSKAADIDSRYLSELISVWQKSDGVYQVATDDAAGDVKAQTLLYVDVAGTDDTMAAGLAKDIQEALLNYAPKVEQQCGRHSFSLVSSKGNVRIDQSLQAQQRDKRAQLKSSRAELKAAVDALQKEQQVVFAQETGSDLEWEETGEQAGSSNVQKYILLGVLAGIFVYCGIYFFWYLFSDKIKNEKEFKMYYAIPFYGSIAIKKSLRESRGKENGVQNDNLPEMAQVLNRIRLVCMKKGMERLCLAAQFRLDSQERGCLEYMAGQLQAWGIDTSVEENMAGKVSAWEPPAQAGAVLLVCKVGATTYRMVDDGMEFFQESGIVVAGAAALEMV